MRRIFQHMYEAPEAPRFVVTDCIAQHEQCFLAWNFEFYFRSFDRATLQVVRGGSHLKFTADGLYEKLPLLGGLMRWLKRRAAQ